MCVFCKIISGEYSSHKIYEDEKEYSLKYKKVICKLLGPTTLNYKITEINEYNEDNKCKYRTNGSKCCQEHHRESEDDSGEVLINQVVGCGSSEILVYLAEQNNSRACSSREHSVHH